MIKILLGGSPCTYWSISQKKNREVLPSGIGWELFKNYKIALEKFKPDFFLYENNKSISSIIKQSITEELCANGISINSALVSAQNRERVYWTNIPNVEQPKDKGTVVADILEDAFPRNQSAYKIKHLTDKEIAYMFRKTKDGRNHFDYGYHCDGTKEKAHCLTANIHKGVPYNVLLQPIRIGTIENSAKNKDFDSQQYRIYHPYGKSVTLCGQGGGVGAKTGLYMVPYNGEMLEIPIYMVENGNITINGEKRKICLPDGLYVIRKLTVAECKRLQTVPEEYEFPVSDTQAYKMLGNGWTVDVISHILKNIPDIMKENVIVLSMYDGMSCGHIALDKIGANVNKYYSMEIDKYAIKTTQQNYPETIQLGDAFRIRE